MKRTKPFVAVDFRRMPAFPGPERGPAEIPGRVLPYGTDMEPCRIPVRAKERRLRKDCHVELLFVPTRGGRLRPRMRFCFKPERPGFIVDGPASPREAARLARKICACGGESRRRLQACLGKRVRGLGGR